MTNELLNEWKKEKIVEDGDIVLAGVSGGADSVCLLLMLEQLQKKTDFLLEAVHVEHGIRGEESRKDAAFVKNLCQDHGIRCHIFSVEVPVFAEKHGLGLEEAARILRYDCYKEAAESVKKEFPEKKFRVLNISLDYEKKKWLEACKEDSKQWIEVCDYKGWSNQVVKQNNIHKLPANILIDRNRKVLGKDLTEKDLYTTVEQLIKKEEKK